MYYIYILRCHDNSLYTGITTDIKRRLNQHINKLDGAAAYTKSRDVTSIEALWISENRSSASKLEYQIKSLTKLKKEALIKKPQLLDAEVLKIDSDLINLFK